MVGNRKLALQPLRAVTCAASSELQARLRSRSVLTSTRMLSWIGSESVPGIPSKLLRLESLSAGGRGNRARMESARRADVSLGGVCAYAAARTVSAASVHRTSRVEGETSLNRTKP